MVAEVAGDPPLHGRQPPALKKSIESVPHVPSNRRAARGNSRIHRVSAARPARVRPSRARPRFVRWRARPVRSGAGPRAGQDSRIGTRTPRSSATAAASS
ncbi:hypothetical protein GCM10018953_44380 [Streptosporangium nondiastaticum]